MHVRARANASRENVDASREDVFVTQVSQAVGVCREYEMLQKNVSTFSRHNNMSFAVDENIDCVARRSS